MLLAKIAGGFFGTVALTGAIAFHQGAINVHVKHHQPGDCDVHVIVPAALVPLVLNFTPEAALERMPAEARRFMPAIRLAAKELRKYPDTVLVDVREKHERVRIETRDGYLVIDVDSNRETVHVSIPLRTIEATARELAPPGSLN